MAEITLKDLSLRDYELTKRVSHLRKNYFRALPQICVERPRLVTRFSLENGLFEQERISILDKAKMYRKVLENRKPIVRHARGYEKGMKPFTLEEASLFAGSTTSKFKGVPLYPEFFGLTVWPELWTISKRSNNPYHITSKEVKELNY
ncbi:MAG: pyruvate formate lyase family protein, partial [Syntrophobacterales bacterium]